MVFCWKNGRVPSQFRCLFDSRMALLFRLNCLFVQVGRNNIVCQFGFGVPCFCLWPKHAVAISAQ